MNYHVPVLLDESTDLLITNRTGTYFDATLGFGGHTSKFLTKLDNDAKIIATDKDIDAYNFCEDKFTNENRVVIYNTGFTDIRTISLVDNIDHYDGIFGDLGVSSFQFDNKSSGFTYRDDAILDLRMNKSKGEPAYEFINSAESDEIADIIYKYGEERRSRQIARSIVKQRDIKQIKSTTELKEAIQKVVPSKNQNKSLSRVFQALRIYVNNELEELSEFLKTSVDLLKIGGRIVIISYHSLEDRIVKDFIKYESLSCICNTEIPVCMCDKQQKLKAITRKPVVPNENELKANPRARSAKLRAAEKI